MSAGKLWVDRCFARWLWYYSWRLEHKRQTKAAKIAYTKLGTAKIFRLYKDAVMRQRSLKAKLAIATGGAGVKLKSIAFRAWNAASRDKRRTSHAVNTLVRKIWREILLGCTRAWREAAVDQAYERKKSNRVETLQEQAKRCVGLATERSIREFVLTFSQAHGQLDFTYRILRLGGLLYRETR